MSKVLFLFVISPRLDPYVNTMTHCVELHHVDKIVINQITEPPIPPMIEDFDKFIHEQMWRMVNGLASGWYVTWDAKAKDFQEVEIDIPDDFDGYKRLRQTTIDHVKLNYQHLRQQIVEMKQRYHPSEVMVDITGAPKRLAADILASCLAAGIENVFTFELLVRSRDPIELLYHNLESSEKRGNKTYEHVLLPSSAPLVANLALFSMNQNRLRLSFAIAAIFLAIVFAMWNYWDGGTNLLLTSVLVAISVFGGILPLVDILLGTRFLQR